MNKQLELIRQKCIEANPEIVELKFGCEVILKQSIFGRQKGVHGFVGATPDGIFIVFPGDGHQIYCEEENAYEVIGRPIRLADVLLAIFEGKVYEKINEVPLILDSGLFGTSTVGHAIKTSGYSWNLRKDDLNEQSEETINFLAKLLQ